MGYFIILFLGGVVGFLCGVVESIPRLKKILRILQTPSYSSNTASDGKIVEISGRVHPELRSLHSPLARKECALWHVEVQEYRSGGEGGSWETIFKESSVHPFDVYQGSITLKVYPTDAEFMLRTDFSQESGPTVGDFEPDIQTAVDKLLSALPYPMDPTRPLKVLEQTVKANETIFILGKIKAQNGKRWISSSNDGSPFLISDRSQFILLSGLCLRVMVSIIVLTAIGVPIAHSIASEI